jgi:RHS repeat-associated protein
MRHVPRSLTGIASAVFVVSIALCVLPLRWAAAQQQIKPAPGTIPNIGGGDKTPPVVLISPSGTTVSSPTVAVTITWCDNLSLDIASHRVFLNGTDVTGSFNYQTITMLGCGAAGKSVGTVYLRQGQQSDTLKGFITDNALNPGSSSVTYTYVYSPPTPAPRYAVSVTPDNAQAIVPASTGNSVQFVVHNTGMNLGGQSVTDSLSVSCTGTGLPNGCSLGSNLVTLAADSAVVSTVTFTPGSAGTSGRIRLLATQRGQPTVVDSGWVNVTVSALTAGAPTVDVATVNPGTAVDRNLCLIVGAGERGARECGDLRVVHPLPSVRTMDKDRGPVLLYNSAFAHPYPIVAANVTLANGTLPPDTILATLHIGGVNYTKRWPGTRMQAGTTRRIAVAFNGIAMATGSYPYTMTVTSIYNASHSQFSSSAMVDTLLLVNRSGSAYGAGWWLAGLEQLFFVTSDSSRVMWVGGDGSTRLYSKTSAGHWAAPAVNRPDTLELTGHTWVRLAEHGTLVKFSSAGLDSVTVNRLGHVTRFSYSGELLTSITLPTPPSGSVIKDSLLYSSGKLHTFTAPGPTPAGRTATITITAGRITSIADPDTSTISFTYLSTASDSNRLQSVVNKLAVATEYAYDSTHHLSLDSTNMGTFPTIVVRFRDADSVELAANALPIVSDSAYVSVDGPRTDVRDVTRFWLDRNGAPSRIIDALGDSTILARTDPRWPALVSRLRFADGRVVLATYNVRGNDSTNTDSTHVLNGVSATTRYLFDNTWDFVTRIVQPMGDSVILAYDATTGNRLYQQPGGDPARRVTFSYDATTKLLRSIQEPLTSKADSLYYDGALGNDSVYVTPRGIRTYAIRDLAGRVVTAKSPIDGAQSIFREKDLTYDAMDRVTSERTYGPAIHYFFHWQYGSLNGITAPSETTLVNRFFDHEGNLDSLSRRASPDVSHVQTLTSRWVYDRDNRVIEEIATDGKADSTGRDAAGNATVLQTRRYGPANTLSKIDSLGLTTMQYDVLNRMVQRQVSATHYPIKWFDSTVTPVRYFPRYTTGYFIPGDVETFTYDAMSRMLSAVNGSALVSRTYNLDGTLATDTLRIRGYASTDSSQHAYGLQYAYDLDGRRTSLRHPHVLAPIVAGVTKDLQTYSYDSVTGALASVTDVLGNTFRYVYDAKQRLDSLLSPGGVREAFHYDDDDQLILRVDSATLLVGQPGGFPKALIHRDSLIYDARGKIVEARTLIDTLRFGYSALGSLVDGATIPTDTLDRLNGEEEFYVTDGLGNRHAGWQLNTHNGIQTDSAQNTRFWFYQAGTAREDSADMYPSGAPPLPINQTVMGWFDGAGDAYASAGIRGNSSAIVSEAQNSYYDALGRLRAFDKRSCSATHADGGQNVCNFAVSVDASDKGYFDEYRYDALGRRVLIRSRSDSTCPASSLQCVSVVQRTVYDGDHVLYELQMPGADSITPSQLERDTVTTFQPNLPFGRVAYTNGLVLDKPLDVIRVGYDSTWPGPEAVIPHANWQGVDDIGSFDDGRDSRCTSYAQGQQDTCIQITWPAPLYGLFFQDPYHDLLLPVAWFGSLINGRRDASGQVFLRNRYYDPEAGRFTQEDPLGLAGGLNAYDFANGDPVNFSDPLGLASEPTASLGTSSQEQQQPLVVGPMVQVGQHGNPRYKYAVVSVDVTVPTNAPPTSIAQNVSLSDKPGVPAILLLSHRELMHKGKFQSTYVYTGTLAFRGHVYSARAEIKTFGTKVFYGTITAAP